MGVCRINSLAALSITIVQQCRMQQCSTHICGTQGSQCRLLICKHSKRIRLQRKKRSVRLIQPTKKEQQTEASKPQGQALAWVVVRGGENLRGFARAEVGGDVSGEIAEEVVDFARLGVGGEASDEEGAELVPRWGCLLRAVEVGAVSGRGCRRRRVGVAVRAVRGGARRGRRRRVGGRGVVEVRGGHAARIARGRAGGAAGYGLPQRRRGWWGVSRWVVQGGPAVVVTGEGAADGTVSGAAVGCFGVRFGIFGLKVSLFRPVSIYRVSKKL